MHELYIIYTMKCNNFRYSYAISTTDGAEGRKKEGREARSFPPHIKINTCNLKDAMKYTTGKPQPALAHPGLDCEWA